MNIPKRLENVTREFNEATKALADMMTRGQFNHIHFANHAAKVALLKGQRDCLDYIISRQINCGDGVNVNQEISAALTENALRGADDNWSGRSNDLRRAHHDGYVQISREFIDCN